MKTLTLIVFAMFALSSAIFASDKACCAAMAGNDTKAACNTTFANLNLSAEQKSKMEKLADECVKGGCNEQTMAKMEKGAQKVLNKEQFAQWKAACSGHAKHEKTQS